MVYLGMALIIANNLESAALYSGLEIDIRNSESNRDFVTKGEVLRMLKEWNLPDSLSRDFSSIDLQEIEDRLGAVDNIEEATVERLANNKVRVTVTAMIPVARVFDRNGSYYINHAGKRLTANSRFRLDVPIVTGEFNESHPAKSLLPLIERISSDEAWNSLIGQISVDPRNRDIILVPMIRGHVINFGDTTAIESKLARIMTMYHEILPVKGWNFYDTLSVKWGGQVVATRRLKSIPEPLIKFDQEGEGTADDDDINSMIVSQDADTAAIGPGKMPKGT